MILKCLTDTIEMRQCFAVGFNLVSPSTLTHSILWMALLRPSWEPDFVLALIFLSFVDLSAKSVFRFHLLLFFIPPSLRSSSIRLYPSATNKFFSHIPTWLKAFSEPKLLYKMLHRSTVFNFTTKYEKLSLKPNIDKFGKHSQTLPLLIFCTSVHLF